MCVDSGKFCAAGGQRGSILKNSVNTLGFSMHFLSLRIYDKLYLQERTVCHIYDRCHAWLVKKDKIRLKKKNNNIKATVNNSL